MSTFDWTPFLVGGGTRPDAMTGLDSGFGSSLAALFQTAPPEIQQNLRITSAYRGDDVQKRLWEDALVKYGSPEAARKWVAPPGRSFHGRGQAVDFKFLDPTAQEWVHANAGDHNLHFPLQNEPWHVEMLGTRGTEAKQPMTFGATVPGADSASLADLFAATPLSLGRPIGKPGRRDLQRKEDEERRRADQDRQIALADLMRY